MEIIKSIDLVCTLSLLSSTDESGKPFRFMTLTAPVDFNGMPVEVALVPKEKLGKQLLVGLIEGKIAHDGKKGN